MKSKAKYRLIEFIRPDGFWPQPYTLEQAFGVFAWMLRTGDGYHDDGQWGRRDVRSLLSCKPTCTNYSAVDPIHSVADLERRFHYALLSQCATGALARWRKDHRIVADGEIIIHFQHHAYGKTPTSEHDAKIALDALLGAQGRLGVQLNKYHSCAREIYGVSLHWRGCYRFILNYGYQGSSWYHPLSRQLPREPFYASFWRAQKALAGLVNGAAPAGG